MSDYQELLSGFRDAPTYPINFAKVLMQIGHEPLDSFKSTDILGRQQVFYPNVVNYIKHIYSLNGFSGIYRGFGMRVISTSVGALVYKRVSNTLDENEELLEIEMKENQTETSFNYIRKKTWKEINLRCWAVVISHPFHVMALRCMAQAFGGETTYSSWNVFQNCIVIYRGEGISGFFSGLIPRLLFEASTVTCVNGIAYLLRTYVFNEEDMGRLIDFFSSFIGVTITYPLSIVSTISCVSGSSLAAANPPNMPIYTSWLGVFKHLSETNGFKRGSSNFYRLYVPISRYSSQIIY